MASRIWVSGYRAQELGVFGDKDPKIAVIKYCLKKTLTEALDTGMTWLITGCQQGTEQWAAEVGLELQPDYPELKIAMMAPFAQFGDRWQEASQAKLAALRARVDFTADVSRAPYQSGRQFAQYGQFMRDHTDGACLLYDPEFPGRTQYDYDRLNELATTREYPLNLITMYDLQEAAATLAEEAENGRFQDF